jgi:peptidoglycan/LPS O-acetylase OafA/YrhL
MLRYRADIDGLRAMAIVPIVLYHAGVQTLRGGYTGVDVFFVISGFLITQVLLVDFSGERFSIAKFYQRRVARIFPALLVASELFCTRSGFTATVAYLVAWC